MSCENENCRAIRAISRAAWALLALSLVGRLAWAGGTPLRLSAAQPLKSIPAKTESFSSDYVPGSREAIRALEWKIDPRGAAVFSTEKDGQQICIPGASLLVQPGKPQAPQVALKESFPLGARILGVRLADAEIRSIEGRIDLQPAPEPVAWAAPDPQASPPGRRALLRRPDPAVYQKDALFPGSLVEFQSGADNESMYACVFLYPLQYNPVQKSGYLLVSARLEIVYAPASEAAPSEPGPLATPAVNVVICPASLYTSAQALEAFHEGEMTVETEIVTTEWINTNYAAAEDPPFTGYKNTSYNNRSQILNYNYTLAKKIVSYLRNSADHPSLQTVTLLGDALLVPPSYYFCDSSRGSSAGYDDWIPTDFFYASPDYDVVPNFRVGRISINNGTEANHVAAKLAAWHPANYNWFKNVTVAGGEPFGTMYYYGEMITLDPVNRDYFNGMTVTKCYQSDGAFEEVNVAPHLSSMDGGITYIISHGSGDAIYLETSNISATEAMGYAANTEVPIMVCIACDCGVYDLDLYPPSGSNSSFGESMLKSNAGGIAYVGGARTNYGAPSHHFDDGRVIIDRHNEMDEMLTYVMQSYHSGRTRLGDLAYDALTNYSAANNLNNSSAVIERVTFFEFVLLGDPALNIPAQQAGSSYSAPVCSAVAPDRYDAIDVPRYDDVAYGSHGNEGLEDLPRPLSETISVNVGATTSPNLKRKRLYTWTWSTEENNGAQTAPGTAGFSPDKSGYYAYRFVTDDAKEAWFYFNCQMEFPCTAPILLVDDDYESPGPEQWFIDSLPVPYNYWEHGPRDEITGTVMSRYGSPKAILWINGLWNGCPDLACQNALAAHLDAGGKLFISGQWIAYDLNAQYNSAPPYFLRDYLCATHKQSYVNLFDIDGVAGDPIGHGLRFNIQGGDGANNQYYFSEIDPISPAGAFLKYDPLGEGGGTIVSSGTAGVHALRNGSKVVFLPFGFEGIDRKADRDLLMQRIIDWLGLVSSAQGSWERYE